MTEPLFIIKNKTSTEAIADNYNKNLMKIFSKIILMVDSVAFIITLNHAFEKGSDVYYQFMVFTLAYLVFLIISSSLFTKYGNRQATLLLSVIFTLVLSYRLLTLLILANEALVLIVYIGLIGIIASAFYLKYELLYVSIITQSILGYYLHSQDYAIDQTIGIIFFSTGIILCLIHIAFVHRSNYIDLNAKTNDNFESSQLLHRLINQLDEIVIIMDYEGNFILTNDAFNTLTGYEVVPTSKDFAVALGRDNFTLMLSTIERTISTQSKQTLSTLPFVTQDKRISYFSLNFQPFRYNDKDQVLVVASDISKERNLSLVKDLVIEINHMLSRAHSLNEYFDLVLDRLLKTISHADLGSVLIIDENDSLTIVSAKGYSTEFVKNFRLPLKDSFYYRLNPSLERHPIIINDIEKLDMSGFTDLLQNQNSLPVYSSLSCPIFLNDTLHGLINIDSSKNNVYTTMDIEVMTFLMDQMSFVISAYYSQEQMRYLSLHDQLTGLLNRWHLETISEKIIPLCLRHHQSFIFTIIDLNNLKVVNDQHGHEIGDNYLKAVSRLLKSHTRQSDLIIRIGGDEIVLVYYSSTLEHCETVLDAINATLNAQMQSLGLPDGLCGMAYGLAKFPDEAGTLKSLMRIADERMYAHKQMFRVHNT